MAIAKCRFFCGGGINHFFLDFDMCLGLLSQTNVNTVVLKSPQIQRRPDLDDKVWQFAHERLRVQVSTTRWVQKWAVRCCINNIPQRCVYCS
jgi:hypothetical protein